MTAQEQLIADQDAQRPARLFLSFLQSATGNDQSLSGADGVAVNNPGQYTTVTPYGVSVEGRPISNLQNATLSMPLALVAVGVVLLLVWKH
jgi:hypothetical protein